MGCDTNCVNEHRFKQIENDLRELKDKNSRDHKEFYDRIEKNEKDMVESTSDRKHINEKLDKNDVNVETLMQKPGKRYDTIIACVITSVVSAVVGFVLNGVLPM